MPTPQQLKQLQLALISAFPDKPKLEQLLYFGLGRNLNQITQESNLQTVVFQLIQTAESQGWLIELVKAAREENPLNSKLAAIADELLSPETSENVSRLVVEKGILHVDLRPVGSDYALVRYFGDNPNNDQPRQLSLAEIEELIEQADRDYYTISPEDYTKTGQALYNWFVGSDHLLANALNEPRPQGLIIAIAASVGLAHLPWTVVCGAYFTTRFSNFLKHKGAQTTAKTD